MLRRPINLAPAANHRVNPAAMPRNLSRVGTAHLFDPQTAETRWAVPTLHEGGGKSDRRRGFTLIELMIVIAIIVGVLALSVPVIRSLEGNRSVDAGYNKLAAALGHARQLALYYRAPAGIVIYKDTLNGTNLIDIAFVTQEKNIASVVLAQNVWKSPPNNNKPLPQDDRYMDIIPGEEILTMPPGVGIQVVTNPAILQQTKGVQPNPVKYLAPLPTVGTDLGDRYLTLGIILFDENGQLAQSAQYFIRDGSSMTTTLGGNLGMTTVPGTPGSMSGLIPPYKLNQPANNPLVYDSYPPGTYVISASAGLYSHSAMCVYDQDAYNAQIDPATGKSFADSDRGTNPADSISYAQYFAAYMGASAAAPMASTKLLEQQWLDQNGVIFVVKPNDGSLLRNP